MDKVNVLIIEDTPAESNRLIKVLEANNYNIVGVATTFKDGLDFFYNHAIDILVIDIFFNHRFT